MKIVVIRVVRGTVIITLLLAAAALILLMSVGILNADWYGRETETQQVSGPAFAADETAPVVRLELHRIVSDTNSVEASVVLVVEGRSPIGEEVKSGATTLTAEVRDASSLEPVAINVHTIVDKAAFQAGWSDAASRSAVFTLPAYTSGVPYPFDDVRVRPFLNVTDDKMMGVRTSAEIQKAFPGREMVVHLQGGIPEIRLSRTTTEVAYILTTGLIFFALSVAIALRLFSATSALTGVQELIAVASYLVAAAGFRDLLGLSRLAGTSVFEILILGVPLVLLAIGVAVSSLRTRREGTISRAA